jgi:hypothetical protein
MSRNVLILGSLGLVLSACGAPHATAPETPRARVVSKVSLGPSPYRPTPKKIWKPRPGMALAPKVMPAAPAEAARKVAMRKLGDFHVYQYGGAFSREPVTLTEQVIGQEGDVLVVDFVLEEGQRMTALRVRMTREGQALAVSRIGADGEAPGTLEDYEALVKKTELVPDTNDEVLAREKTACLVGEEQVECEVTTYRVSLGKNQAKLTITKSDALPGRDIGGDMVGEDGKVLYSARLVERGNEAPVAEALAQQARLVPERP